MQETKPCSFTFRLRTLLLAVFAFALLMSVLAERLNDKRRERRLVERITSQGGTVCYDYQRPRGQVHMDESAEPNGPRWLRKWLGGNFFSDVVLVAYPDAQDSDLDEIGRWTSLRVLYLSDSAVTDDGLASIAPLRNLEELYLHNTDIGGSGLACVGGYDQIQAIGLDGTRVTGTSLRTVRTRKRLSLLSLSQIGLSDADVLPLTDMASVRDLDLSHNNLSNRALTYLESMTGLDTLDLTGNDRISEHALIRLREKLPGTKIWPLASDPTSTPDIGQTDSNAN